MTAPRDCPCFSGLRYLPCCAALHRGEGVAATPEALMRERYSAFALGLGAYLIDSLAREHADRAAPRDALLRTLSSARGRQRFLGLTIVHASQQGDDGEVLFFARIFERGENRSFAELSRFRREDGGFRYVDGVMVDASRLPADPSSLTREGFLALAGDEGR